MGTDELLDVLKTEIGHCETIAPRSAKSEGEQALGYNSGTGAPAETA
ncbi:hypothetical protein ACKUUI_08455 [Mycobacterium seoulense]